MTGYDQSFANQRSMGSAILTSFTLFKFNGKYKMFRNSQNIILSCVCRSNHSIRWLQEILQQLDGDYGECAMKIALVAWVGYRAGTQYSLVLLFQSISCTVLMEIPAAYSQLSTALCG